ncbi:MAG: SCO family protein [Alphaproteobacteria bacterium]|nr:SCO family protein [Alphaproteobacteria bacterium]
MRRAMAAVVAAFCLLGAPLAAAAPPAEHTTHSYAPPDPSSLGGTFVLRDPAGRMVSSQNLKGRWTLVYIGYSRCTDTCPVALPSIVQAAKDLSASGVPARAVFIDIEPPPASVRPRNPTLQVSEASHHDPLKQQAAMAEIVKRFGNSLLVLTGSRNQLSAVTVAFQVRREHVPARPREEGHSINHTSFIYLMAPSGEVKQYLYHDAAPDVLAAAVRKSAALR